MSILSFRCVVTKVTNGTETFRRRTWIEADAFRALALAATREIGSTPAACGYTLFRPEVPEPPVFLEVAHDEASALVGPMGGPRPPAALVPDRFYGFEEFLCLLGIARRPPGAAARGASGAAADADGQEHELPSGTYPVTVRFAGIWHHEPTSVAPPIRDAHESAAAFRARCDEVEQRRIARARHEGLHVVSYPVSAPRWRPHDIERLMGLAYALLPTSEPRWRQSGTITQETLPTLRRRSGRSGRRPRRPRVRRPAYAWCLEVGRGEYVASLRLPEFPTLALAEWLGRRPCEISLCHAVDRTEQEAGTRSLWPRPPRARRLRGRPPEAPGLERLRLVSGA